MASKTTPDWKKLGSFVEQRRVELGLSKTAAIARARISMSTWRRIESGGNPAASPETLSRIARALELDIKELFAAGRIHAPHHGKRGPARMTKREALEALLADDQALNDTGRAALLAVYDAVAIITVNYDKLIEAAIESGGEPHA